MYSTVIAEAPAPIQARPTSREVFAIQILRQLRCSSWYAGIPAIIDLYSARSVWTSFRLKRIRDDYLHRQTPPQVKRTVFIRRRIVRIVPLYWLFTGLEVLRDRAVGQHHALMEVISSLLFVPCRFNRPLNISYYPILRARGDVEL